MSPGTCAGTPRLCPIPFWEQGVSPWGTVTVIREGDADGTGMRVLAGPAVATCAEALVKPAPTPDHPARWTWVRLETCRRANARDGRPV